MKNIIRLMAFVILGFSFAQASELEARAINICKTEIMYAANPPKIEDCVRQKIRNPDYKSVISYETFDALKYNEKPQQ